MIMKVCMELKIKKKTLVNRAKSKFVCMELKIIKVCLELKINVCFELKIIQVCIVYKSLYRVSDNISLYN